VTVRKVNSCFTALQRTYYIDINLMFTSCCDVEFGARPLCEAHQRRNWQGVAKIKVWRLVRCSSMPRTAVTGIISRSPGYNCSNSINTRDLNSDLLGSWPTVLFLLNQCSCIMDGNALPSLQDAAFQELFKQFATREFDQQAELAEWNPDKYILEHAIDSYDPSLPALPPLDADAGEHNPQWNLEGAEMINRDMEQINVEQPFHL
jgi:hypothetical protein